MNSYSGLLKIVRFNWPWYVLATTTTLLVLLGAFLNFFRGFAFGLVVGALIIANLWVLLSLVVSHYVYDRSAIARGAWLDAIDPERIRRAAIFHAGQNEASPVVEQRLSSKEIQLFDFYDEERNGTRSLKRARALNPHRDLAISPESIPADDSIFDVAFVVFSAHEIRDDAQRADFFREVRRVITPSGRVIVVEHLRDLWNLVAYGPGAFHFLSEQTWRESFTAGNLEVSAARRCTPFVRVFELKKSL